MKTIQRCRCHLKIRMGVSSNNISAIETESQGAWTKWDWSYSTSRFTQDQCTTPFQGQQNCTGRKWGRTYCASCVQGELHWRTYWRVARPPLSRGHTDGITIRSSEYWRTSWGQSDIKSVRPMWDQPHPSSSSTKKCYLASGTIVVDEGGLGKKTTLCLGCAHLPEACHGHVV